MKIFSDNSKMCNQNYENLISVPEQSDSVISICCVFCKNDIPCKGQLTFPILRYIVDHRIELSPMYGDVVKVDGKYMLTGCARTGCMFCPVPIAHGDCRNLEYARKHHPKMYETITAKFGLLDMLRKVQINNGQQDLFEETGK